MAVLVYGSAEAMQYLGSYQPQFYIAVGGCLGLKASVVPGQFCRAHPHSVDLRSTSSQADPSCLVRRDALDGLTVVATLVHEL